jgi:hypothetical protein
LGSVRLNRDISLYISSLISFDEVFLIGYDQVKGLQQLIDFNPFVPVNFKHFFKESNELIAEVVL